MTATEKLNRRLEEFRYQHDHKECQCGGLVRVGWNPVRLVVRQDDLAHTTDAWYNCDQCGAGERVQLTEACNESTIG